MHMCVNKSFLRVSVNGKSRLFTSLLADSPASSERLACSRLTVSEFCHAKVNSLAIRNIESSRHAFRLKEAMAERKVVGFRRKRRDRLGIAAKLSLSTPRTGPRLYTISRRI